jgi:hydrogenase 3 maturation protease
MLKNKMVHPVDAVNMSRLKSTLENRIKAKLKENKPERILIVGLGNRMKSDDGAGSLLAERLEGRVKAPVIDAGISLENYAGPIIRHKPDTVILIDAVYIEKKPGTVEIIEESDMENSNLSTLSTHSLSPLFFLNYLRRNGVLNILVIGIRPEIIIPGEGMSLPVKEAVRSLEYIFMDILN